MKVNPDFERTDGQVQKRDPVFMLYAGRRPAPFRLLLISLYKVMKNSQ